MLTASLAGDGYLNFMGNEFGHPEWIDFPREGNDWSYHYCRRQWSLVDNPDLRYGQLDLFDKEMISLLKKEYILGKDPVNLWSHEADKIIIYAIGNVVFAFNFNPIRSFDGYWIPVPQEGSYKVLMSTDDGRFGGFDRVAADYHYMAHKTVDGSAGFRCYLPNRCAMVLKKMPGGRKKKEK